jgi:hypothetical protein
MRVVQLLVDPLPLSEARHQEIDHLLLGDSVVATERAEAAASVKAIVEKVRTHAPDLVHVYGPHVLPRRLLGVLALPYVSTGIPATPRFPFTFASAPSPRERLTFDRVPEAVRQEQFDEVLPPRERKEPYVVGSTGRAALPAVVAEGVYERIRRFRDDVEWRVYDGLPTPADLASVDVWVDPAVSEDDFDGGVAEALVSGVTVVATRTVVNVWRTDDGAAAFLCPPGDANVMTHAIAEALFKPEMYEEKLASALTIRDRFDPAERMPRLLAVYRRVLE